VIFKSESFHHNGTIVNSSNCDENYCLSKCQNSQDELLSYLILSPEYIFPIPLPSIPPFLTRFHQAYTHSSIALTTSFFYHGHHQATLELFLLLLLLPPPRPMAALRPVRKLESRCRTIGALSHGVGHLGGLSPGPRWSRHAGRLPWLRPTSVSPTFKAQMNLGKRADFVLQAV
jgi:hypothetical protein